MEFDILGPLEVRRGGTPVAISSPKQRALLILLVLEAGRTVAVDRLIEDLWAGEPPPQALVTLRSYVSNLRRLLGGGEEGPLVTRGRGYMLDVAPAAVDAARFESLLRAGRSSLGSGNPAAAIEALEAALGLWRGSPLADVAYESFAQAAIARLDELRLQAEEDLAEALLAAGRHLDAVPMLGQVVAAQPLRERPRAQLMVALYRAGRAPDALDVYHDLRRTLADELGLDPSGDLERLAHQILVQSPELDLAGHAAPSPVDAAPTPPAAPHPLPVPGHGVPGREKAAVVGRDAERSRLVAAVDRLAAGEGGLLVVAGEPGIGKTTMLRELASLASQRGAATYWGRHHDSEGTPAFWAWSQVVRAVVADLDDDALTALVAGVVAPITSLVEEVAARTGVRHELTGDDTELARFQLYDAVTTFLHRAAGATGTVLLLDDIHWADAQSLQLLAFVAPRLAGSRLLVAAAFRDLAVARTLALDATLAAVAREPATEQISLRGLSTPDVATVLAEVTGEAPSDELAAVVHDRSGGNPFFVQQLARLLDGLRESDADVRLEDSVPAEVRHVLMHRLQALPAEVATLLDAAAAAGREFDLRIVAPAARTDLDAAIDAMDVAVAHGLVEPVGSPVTVYRFVHALVRETVHDRLSPAGSARLHSAVGEALERLPAPPVHELAEHFWRAADLIGPERPIRYAVAAAGDAVRNLAYEQAESYLRRALHLATHAGDPAGELEIRVRLLSVLVGIHGWSSEAVEHVAGPARGLVGAEGITRDVVPLWWQLWVIAVTRSELPTALELADRLLADAEASGDPVTLAAGHVLAGYAHLSLGADPRDVLAHTAEAQRHAALAPTEALSLAPEHVTVSAHAVHALAQAYDGEGPAARQSALRAIAVARDVGAPVSQAYAHIMASRVGVLLEDPAFVAEVTSTGLELCERHGFRHMANLLVPADGWARTRLGEDPASQAERIVAAVEAAMRDGNAHTQAQHLVLAADVFLRAGDRDGAVRSLEAARAHAARTGDLLPPRPLAGVEGDLTAAV